MTLLYIVLSTLFGGVLSVVVAASLTVHVLGRVVHHLVSLSAGVLLGTALLHLMPEAIAAGAKTGAGVETLFATLLGGILFFFLLEKAELYRHTHHHEGDGHDHHAHFDAQQVGRGGYAVLLGDGVHNFCDGIIIAAAFLADVKLGFVTALAVTAHEIPQETGDYIVLLNAGFARRKALIYNGLSGLSSVVGGVIGYFIVAGWEPVFPYLLVIASSSFVYVSVADLIPQMQRRMPLRDIGLQVLWLAAGLAIVLMAMHMLHAER